MNFDEVIQLQVLKLKSMASGRALKEAVIAQTGDHPQIRQMCAKVSVELYKQLEEVCVLLGMSKREFIEAAVSDALERAHEVIERSGVVDSLSAREGN